MHCLNKSGAAVSILKKNNHLYLIIVNKDYSGEMTINITAKHNIPRYLTKELKEESLKTTYTIAAGDIFMTSLQ